MSNEAENKTEANTAEKTNSVQAGNTQNEQVQNITIGVEDFKSVIQSTIESVLKSSRTEQFRKDAEQYNTKIAEAVQNSQATIMKPATDVKYDLNYINNVFIEDDRKRRLHPEGKALYAETGEDFLKAKIILLKKIGLTNEEILKEIQSITV